MLIDFEKAFDSVSRDFLYAILKFFKFGDGFVKGITVFNENIKAYVNKSGFLSAPWILNMGVTKEIQ